MNNIADKYYTKVVGGSNPIWELTCMFAELYDLKPSTSMMKVFQPLVNLFGEKRVFLATIYVYLNHEYKNIERSIHHFEGQLRKRLMWNYEDEMDRRTTGESKNLDTYIEEQAKYLEQKRSEFRFVSFDSSEESND